MGREERRRPRAFRGTRPPRVDGRRAHRARGGGRHRSPLHERGRRALCHGEALGRHRKRLACERALRPALVRQTASALLRHIRARAGKVRARREGAHARRRGPQDDRPDCLAAPPSRSRHRPRRCESGPRRVRSSDDRRYGDVRRSASLSGRHRAGHRQRRRCPRSGRDDARTRRAVPPPRPRSRRSVNRGLGGKAPQVAILAEGQFAPATAKTAIGVLRYAPYPVVAVVDSTKAGTDAARHVGIGAGVAVVATVHHAVAAGIAIAGEGISVDAVVADFVAGATERMVCDAAERADWVIVEGQGSLTHPGFSGVTLGLLHGAGPDAMVLCHAAFRQTMKGYEREGLPVRDLRDLVRIYEDAAEWRRPPGYPRARVVAIALNTIGMSPEHARSEIGGATHATKLPAADPIREGVAGADRLAEAIRGAVPA